jgi:hypothetical protein
LAGVPCREGTAGEGVVRVAYDAEGDISLSCGIARYTLSLAITGGDGNAAIEGSPLPEGFPPFLPPILCAGIETPAQCSPVYDAGTVVTLRAFDAQSSHVMFDHWEGGCTGTDRTCAVTMDQARSVTAVFVEAVDIRIELTSPKQAECFLGFCGYSYLFDGGVTWSAGSCIVLPGITPPDAASPHEITTVCIAHVQPGGSLTLTAASNDIDIGFISWSGACSGTPPCALGPLNADVVVGARFALN